MLDFWQNVNDNIRKSFLRECTQQQLDEVLEQKTNPTSLDAKYSILESIAQENSAMHVLAYMRSTRANYVGAEMTWRQLLHSNHPSEPNLNALYNLAFSLIQQRKFEEAEAIFRALTPLVQIRLGENSPQALGCVRKLGWCAHGQGRFEEAREILGIVKMMAKEIEDEGLRGDEVEACKALEERLGL